MAEISRAVVLDKPNGSFTVYEVQVPDPGQDELVVQIELCGVCGTDVHIYDATLPGVTYPLVLGHEPVGIISRLGKGVTQDYTGRPVKEGDRIYILAGFCGRCYYCSVADRPNMCENAVCLGAHCWPDREMLLQGGFAQYAHLSDPMVAFLRMDGVDADTAVSLEPLGTAVQAVERANIRVGSTVVIQGSGAIGLFTLMAARELGALKTIMVGAPETRLTLAREFGADVTINIEEITDPQQRIDMVKTETTERRGADVVFECTGVPAAVPEGIDMTRIAGTYVVVGQYSDQGTVPINPYYITIRDLTVIGSKSWNVGHNVRARALMEANKYPVHKAISHKMPLERVGDVIAAMQHGYRLDGSEIRKVAIAPWK